MKIMTNKEIDDRATRESVGTLIAFLMLYINKKIIFNKC